MDKNSILKEIRKTLLENIDEKTRSTSQNFFKEQISAYGVRIPTVGKISKLFFQQISNLPKKDILNLCENLWESGVLEESFIACNWSYYTHKSYEKQDFETFEKWVSNYVNNWASCDTLCNHTIGTFLEMYPEDILKIMKWTSSTNRWAKRGAAVSLIIPARKGLFFKEILKIADSLLLDKDDLVQKGYGWMLKAASEANQKAVFDYVMLKKEIMPRTSLRYAIEKMPAELKKEAMKK